MQKHRRDAGFSLAALIFFATAASILAAAAVPAYQMQAKREVEEELIFRGEEYTREKSIPLRPRASPASDKRGRRQQPIWKLRLRRRSAQPGRIPHLDDVSA